VATRAGLTLCSIAKFAIKGYITYLNLNHVNNIHKSSNLLTWGDEGMWLVNQTRSCVLHNKIIRNISKHMFVIK